MNLKAALFAGLLALVSWPAAALDLNAMTDEERQLFRAEVRAYLLDNPEVLIEAISVLEARQQQAQINGDLALVAQYSEAIFNDGYSFVGGNPDGDITIVEFLDYRCGFCKRAFPEVTELIASDGNIRFVIKEYPILGEQSTLASRFALSVRARAGDEAYLAIHNELMESNGQVTEGSLRRIARTHGLDADAVLDGMQATEIDEIIAANHQLARSMQISGTPSFVMGGTMLRGYAPLDDMRSIIAQQRGG